MRIDATTTNSNLSATLMELIAGGAVVDLLTSDLELYVTKGVRKPTLIYRPAPESQDHVWLACPTISADAFDVAMDQYNAHWATLQQDPAWRQWIATHPVPADVLAAE